MKIMIVLAAALAAVAGPAAAEFGRPTGPSGFQKPRTGISPAPSPSPYKSPYAAPDGSASPKPKTYGAPAADPFKPYEPYKSSPGTSVFGPDGRKKR